MEPNDAYPLSTMLVFRTDFHGTIELYDAQGEEVISTFYCGADMTEEMIIRNMKNALDDALASISAG